MPDAQLTLLDALVLYSSMSPFLVVVIVRIIAHEARAHVLGSPFG